jgi:hypothetical protein
MTRQKGKMDLNLFKKIIDEAKTWCSPLEICPVHYGEFFLNKDWLQILQYIEEKLPHCKISIPTNGSKFTDEVIDELVKIKNLHYVSFSLYSDVPDTYRTMIGLPEETIQIIERSLIKLREKRPDVLVCLGSTSNSLFLSPIEMRNLKIKWGELIALHDITLNQSHNFHKSFHTTEICSELYHGLYILWNGKVCACCMDANGELEVGDANASSIMEIWNGEPLKRLRRLHEENKRNEIPLCDSCTCTKLPRAYIQIDSEATYEFDSRQI